MGFVEDDAIVCIQEAIALDFGEEHAVRHELDEAGWLGLVIESNFVADDFPSLGFHLFGQTVGDRAGGDSTRLSMPDPTELAQSCFDTKLW